MKFFLSCALLIFPLVAAAADKPLEKCGPFELEAGEDGYMHIDGVKPWSQKITGAKGNDMSGATFHWMVPYPNVGWLGMVGYIGADHRRWLDVQYVQDNKDAPKLYGQYPCRPIKG